MTIKPITDIPGILSGLLAIEGDTTLIEEINFDKRAHAIDFIDFHIVDRISGLLQDEEANKESELYQHALKVKSILEKVDAKLFTSLRENIRTGMYTPATFNNMVRRYLGHYFNGVEQPGKIGYDNLDIFINGLLSHEAIPHATLELRPDMVFYQKTPARIVFELADLAALTKEDVFFDLGSGLGQVAMLVNLLSGAPVKGLEYEPAYCDYANACALNLNLPGVKFMNADARTGDYSQGTVFFLYTPFEKNMLQDMLNVLHKESQQRTIRIYTYGPCSTYVAQQRWLKCINGNPQSGFTLCGFINLNS